MDLVNKIKKMLERIAKKILAAENIVFVTGAGISKDSGIQTFRDTEGLWKNFDPGKLATLEGFISDPVSVWNWYLLRIEKIKEAKPNAGHFFVAQVEKLKTKTHVITQNIDGLHKKAGSKRVIELHGNVENVKCLKCSNKKPYELVDFSVLPPKCECGGLLRPDVVWFGEALPYNWLIKAFDCAKQADLLITIGTSNVVYPVAEIPFVAKGNGSFIIEINPEDTPLTAYADMHFSEPSNKNYEILISLIS